MLRIVAPFFAFVSACSLPCMVQFTRNQAPLVRSPLVAGFTILKSAVWANLLLFWLFDSSILSANWLSMHMRSSSVQYLRERYRRLSLTAYNSALYTSQVFLTYHCLVS